LASTSLMALASNGEELFQEKCASCHITHIPQDMSKLVAPPLFGLMKHVKEKYKNKNDALAFMRDYVVAPAKKKALCKPGKIKHFGLMPSQKGKVTPEELREITVWMYDNFPPKGFKESHGKGKTRMLLH